MEGYHQQANVSSLDGCGGLKVARRGRGENVLLQDALIWFRRVLRQREAMVVGAIGMLFALAVLRLLANVFERIAVTW